MSLFLKYLTVSFMFHAETYRAWIFTILYSKKCGLMGKTHTMESEHQIYYLLAVSFDKL